MYENIQKTLHWLEANTSLRPSIGIILGSGLGNLAEQIASPQRISYKDIPNFPVSTVEGHSGNLVLGLLGGKAVMAMQGRFHYYEGYSMKELSFPLRVMKA
ncbi:MAG: purine-nucleoside phosphorylase, partial [Bacteroidales bacterium]|nr:purine-nucleoside phosphorylase [Bacteroidales bacterium]